MADATITVDPPSSANGSWWLDIQRYGHIASIEWRPGKGFGVAYPGGGYGEGVDFVVNDAATAAEHVSRQFESAQTLSEAKSQWSGSDACACDATGTLRASAPLTLRFAQS